MRRKYVLVAAVVTTLAGQEVGARTLEDVLTEKGVITEEDYKEVTRSKPGANPRA